MNEELLKHYAIVTEAHDIFIQSLKAMKRFSPKQINHLNWSYTADDTQELFEPWTVDEYLDRL